MRRSSHYYCRGATAARVPLLLSVGLILLGLAPRAAEAALLGSYFAVKAGIYSPSAVFNLDNVDIDTTFEGDTRTGINGELAVGHYVLPTVALELGVGYFNGKGSFDATSPSLASHQVDYDVVPVLLSAKALIPAGPVNPYGELGIGAYFTKFNVSDNLNTFSGTTTFGLHAGGGLNVTLTPTMFLGVEGRYVWANPSFGNQKIKLNDTEFALNGFKLNGFTTTLGLGLAF